MKQDLQVIKFYDNEIFTVEKDGEHYVAMKPICEGIGLQWQAQFNRIKRHPVLSEVVSMMDTTCLGIDGKKYVKKMMMLPLKMLNGWLFGVDTNRVKPEIRERLIKYQRECFDVLYKHWQNRSKSGETADLETEAKVIGELEVFMEMTRLRLPSCHDDSLHNRASIHTAMVLKHLYHLDTDSLQLNVDIRKAARKLKISPRQFRDGISRLKNWQWLLTKSKSADQYWVVLLHDPIQAEMKRVRYSMTHPISSAQHYNEILNGKSQVTQLIR